MGTDRVVLFLLAAALTMVRVSAATLGVLVYDTHFNGEQHRDSMQAGLSGLGELCRAHAVTLRILTGMDAGALSGTQRPDVLLIYPCGARSEAAWRKLDAYNRDGGGIIWSGTYSSRFRVRPADLTRGGALMAAQIGPYRTDPELGKGAISRFMWVVPVPDSGIFRTDSRPAYAAFAGEAMALTPTAAGRSAAVWAERDRQTRAGGPAMVLSDREGRGRTAAFGWYPVSLASTDSLVGRHAREILVATLQWCGVLPAHLSPASGGEPRQRLFTPLPAGAPTPRAMWVWHTRDLLADAGERDDLIRFCRQRRINRLYLYVNAAFFSDETTVQALSSLLALTHASGISVEGLDGYADAVLPGKSGPFLATLDAVLAYNRRAAAAGAVTFAGFQSDVEPQSLTGVSTPAERRRRNERFVELEARCAARIRAAGAPVGFRFGLAMDANYDSPRRRGTALVAYNGREALVSEHMIAIHDYVATMSYFDTAERVIAAVGGEISVAAALGRQVVIGQETLDLAGRGFGNRDQTYAEEGTTYMEGELRRVDAAFAGHRGYGGLALHTWSSYSRLPPAPRAGSVPSLSVAPRTGEITVDGAAGDWPTGKPLRVAGADHVLHGRGEWQGDDDLSAAVRVLWGAEGVYVLAEVRDDHFVGIEEGEDIWKDDHVEIWLAAAAAAPAYQFGISPRPEKPAVAVWYPKSLSTSQRRAVAAQVRAATRLTEDGYTVEVFIPAGAFGGARLEAGMTLPYLVEPGDRDRAGHEHDTLLSTAPGRKRGRPRTFSTLHLEDNRQGRAPK